MICHQEADAWVLQTKLWLFCRMSSLAQIMDAVLARIFSAALQHYQTQTLVISLPTT